MKIFRFKYESDFFPNPSLASFYSNLEALVYDEEVQVSEDNSIPRCEEHDQKIQDFLDDIEEEFGTVSAYRLFVRYIDFTL